MPLSRRPQAPAVQQAAADAALNAPARRRRSTAGPALLTTFEQAPLHLRSPFILRGYRAGYNFRRILASLFDIHNETGNIWTHLIGFVIFVCLTVATVKLRPAPLRLGADALLHLEQRLHSLGKGAERNLYELVSGAEAWERSALRYGADTLAALEARLRGIGRHNVAELAGAGGALAQQVRSTVGTKARGFSSWLRHQRASAAAELAHAEGAVAAYGGEAVRDVEAALHRALAAVLDTSWPVARWPLYVFTAGAMVCLLTSSVCHLFGCCAAHLAALMWRFDYAGIAVLIVCSFYPPVFYLFMCYPGLQLFYLSTTTALGLSSLTVTLMDRFQSPRFHVARASLFAGLGVWGIVPLLHSWWLLGAGEAEVGAAVRLDVVMGAIYLLGAAIYATRVPERWKPGAFDVALHSHQLFHVAVVVAAVLHYKASAMLLHWRDATGGCMAFQAAAAAEAGR